MFGSPGTPVTTEIRPALFAGPTERLTSLGHNIIGSEYETSGWFTGPGDRVGAEGVPLDAGLMPLADNGGPTFTHALSATSPARDGGSTAAPGSADACESTDQRGHARPGVGSASCDSGAFEAADAPVAKITGPSALTTPNPAGRVTAVFDGSTSLDPNGSGNAGLTYEWSIDGQLVAAPPSYLLEASLPVGSHLISLTVMDVEGLTGTATKTVEVTVPNIPFPILHLPGSLALEVTHGFEAVLPPDAVTATDRGAAIGFSCWTTQTPLGRFMNLTLGVNTVRCKASVAFVPRAITATGTFTVTVTAPLALSKAQTLLANAQQATGSTVAMKNVASRIVTAIETARPKAVCPALSRFVDVVTAAGQQNKITATVMTGFIAQAGDLAQVAACEP